MNSRSFKLPIDDEEGKSLKFEIFYKRTGGEGTYWINLWHAKRTSCNNVNYGGLPLSLLL